MSRIDLARFTDACNYPGTIHAAAVERHLQTYLDALGVKRRIQQLPRGWRIEDHAALSEYVNGILDDIVKRNPGIRARAARAARNARDALAALAARDVSAARDARAARAARDARDARAALDASAALDALNASAARDARDARAARDALAARDARAARDASAALDARAALDASAALDALNASAAHDAVAGGLQRFAAWCIQTHSWSYWRFDLSWDSCTAFGARQLRAQKVSAWAEPLLEAFISGCWMLHWTEDTL